MQPWDYNSKSGTRCLRVETLVNGFDELQWSGSLSLVMACAGKEGVVNGSFLGPTGGRSMKGPAGGNFIGGFGSHAAQRRDLWAIHSEE